MANEGTTPPGTGNDVGEILRETAQLREELAALRATVVNQVATLRDLRDQRTGYRSSSTGPRRRSRWH